jgi:hypothetical protein
MRPKLGQVLWLIAFLTAASCGSSNNSPTAPTTPLPTPNLPNGGMTAQIDGAAWVATTSIITNAGTTAFGLDGSSVSTQGSGIIISFVVNGTTVAPIQAGQTYSMALPNSANLISVTTASPGGQSSQIWTASSGTVAISSYTTSSATGTFSFTATGTSGTRTVSSGAFNVTF